MPKNAVLFPHVTLMSPDCRCLSCGCLLLLTANLPLVHHDIMCHDVAKQRSKVYRLLLGSCFEANFPAYHIRTVSLVTPIQQQIRGMFLSSHFSQQFCSPMACKVSLLDAGQYIAQPQTTMHDCIPRTNLSSLLQSQLPLDIAALTSIMHNAIVIISCLC